MRLDYAVHTAMNEHIASTSLIKGQIRHEGVPISCEVTVLDRQSKAVLSRVVSDDNGHFFAWGSHEKPNIVIAVDPYNDHNIASQDNVK